MKSLNLKLSQKIPDIKSIRLYDENLWVHYNNGDLSLLSLSGSLNKHLSDVEYYEKYDNKIFYQSKNLESLKSINIKTLERNEIEGEFSLLGCNVYGQNFFYVLSLDSSKTKVLSVLSKDLVFHKHIPGDSIPVSEFENGMIYSKKGGLSFLNIETMSTEWYFEFSENEKFQKYPNQFLISGTNLILNISKKSGFDTSHSLLAIDLKKGVKKWVRDIPWLFFQDKNRIFIIQDNKLVEIDPETGNEINSLKFNSKSNFSIPLTSIKNDKLNAFSRFDKNHYKDEIHSISLNNMTYEAIYQLDNIETYNFKSPIIAMDKVFLHETFTNQLFVYE
ncbi:hypothetical protein [Mangrovivirga cuniculi]|uniref:Uncharacterized protein n=1 Tax=Mangrovivirga cuniculi TaxID=2715131 RepID=A0A4D7JKZ8_9BACT|nr:hypothetical protein [Mangrovivirga cuniculi]QCK15573.1 hypothetical protein DCC35_12860 [Mangrovivirga cuniculi]